MKILNKYSNAVETIKVNMFLVKIKKKVLLPLKSFTLLKNFKMRTST